MAIKAIVLDIDGTLLNKDKIITPLTKETLIKCGQKGIKLILASGRPTNGMLHLAKEIEMDKTHGLCISFNGAKVVDAMTNEVLFDKTMPVDLCKRILNHMKKFEVRPMIVKGDYSYVTNVYNHMVHVTMHGEEKDINIMDHEAHDNNYLLCEVKDLEQFCDFPLNKILNIGDPIYLNEHYKEIAEPFLNEANSMFTAPYYYEFTAQGIDKTKALKEVLDILDIKASECIAFGDAQNDKSMVEFAGIGVAMGNAVDELKAVANEITDSCNDDGIAKSLFKHIEGLN